METDRNRRSFLIATLKGIALAATPLLSWAAKLAFGRTQQAKLSTSNRWSAAIPNLDISGTERFCPTFNVMDYGAIGDGVTDDTAAIQRAIDAASRVDGAQVLFPRPGCAISSTIQMRSNTLNTKIDCTKLIWIGKRGSVFDIAAGVRGATISNNVAI